MHFSMCFWHLAYAISVVLNARAQGCINHKSNHRLGLMQSTAEEGTSSHAREEDAVSAHRGTTRMGKLSGNEWPGQAGECGQGVPVHFDHVVREQMGRPGRRMRRMFSQVTARVRGSIGE